MLRSAHFYAWDGRVPTWRHRIGNERRTREATQHSGLRTQHCFTSTQHCFTPTYDALMPPTLIVPRARFSLEEPWAIPEVCTAVSLRNAQDGSAPRLTTTFAAYHDGVDLTLVFLAEDDHIVSTHVEHDAPLYEEDVVEAFLAPARLEEYLELEVSPRGTTFDARITSPDGVRATMKGDLGWTCEGLAAATFIDTVNGQPRSLRVVMRIPFAALGTHTPRAGETWRANFFRIDRHDSGDEYSAWSPTMKTPADFHVAAAFGTLRFADE